MPRGTLAVIFEEPSSVYPPHLDHSAADRLFPIGFYRTAAVASGLSALTTLGLILLPEFYMPLEGFAGRMHRVSDPAYQLRSWIYLLHPFLVLAAALGVAMRLWRRAAAWALPGLLGFVVWAVTEAAQQAMTLVAFDRWRRAYLAGDEAVRATMELRTALYDSAWDASYVLLLIAFLFGCVCYAMAMRRVDRLGRVVALLFIAAAALTVNNLSAEFAGPTLSGTAAQVAYLLLQPLARVLIAVWLWRNGVWQPDATHRAAPVA